MKKVLDIKMWVDKVNCPPKGEGYSCWCKTYDEAVIMFENKNLNIIHVSMDTMIGSKLSVYLYRESWWRKIKRISWEIHETDKDERIHGVMKMTEKLWD